MELYGCNYIPDVLHFNGKSMIKREMSHHPVTSLRDTFRFRFKTNHENGVILYSKGSQGDYLALQMVENRLLLNINLGSRLETSMALGSLLDDNVYHEVVISRNRKVLFNTKHTDLTCKTNSLECTTMFVHSPKCK